GRGGGAAQLGADAELAPPPACAGHRRRAVLRQVWAAARAAVLAALAGQPAPVEGRSRPVTTLSETARGGGSCGPPGPPGAPALNRHSPGIYCPLSEVGQPSGPPGPPAPGLVPRVVRGAFGTTSRPHPAPPPGTADRPPPLRTHPTPRPR